MLTQLEVNKSNTNTGIKIFTFKGELDETNVDATFNNIITEIGDFTGSITIFDFKGLTYLNSKSIGYIADIAQRTDDGSGKFGLCSLSHDVGETLDFVGILSMIPAWDNIEIAIAEVSK